MTWRSHASRKDDTVMVIAGTRARQDRQGPARAARRRTASSIEGLNMVKRHTKPRGAQQPGGIVEKEASIHLSNVHADLCDAATSRRASGTQRLEDGRRRARLPPLRRADRQSA